MSMFDKLRSQKLLSFTLVLFTLSIGIVIGTLINSGVKAAKDTEPGARRDGPSDSQPRRAFDYLFADRQAGRALGGEYFDHLSSEGAHALAQQSGVPR